MFVTILDRYGKFPDSTRSKLFLTWDDWNDFGYRTTFGVFYVDEFSKKHDLEGIKIGFQGQKTGLPKLKVGDSFDELESDYFSLGSTHSYYENLNTLEEHVKVKIFKALHDIAKFDIYFEMAIIEDVTQISLLRSISETEVLGQFRRIANGGALLTPYDFVFETTTNHSPSEKIQLKFNVIPDSNPATNVNVLIGRNGSGKTTILKNLVSTLLHDNTDSKLGELGIDNYFMNTIVERRIFPVLINVSFSAFDSGNKHIKDIELEDIKYYYVGLKKEALDKSNGTLIKTPSDLNIEFFNSLNSCRKKLLKKRWSDAIAILESDVNFKDEDISSLIDVDESIINETERDKTFKDAALSVFSKLSSGHKIVLLTITRLVELVEEKALVLIDEPETHLHPPLLSAFNQSLSNLLINRNGVAIIATHSPVLLQEVPMSCVWKIVRNGNVVSARRLRIESFGEDVGTLTHEIFNLEVTNSGFHKNLKEAVAKTNSYDEAIQYFNNNLGLEAKAILHSLYFQKDQNK